MRLTLRTLLAYLDDTLDPALTRQIGEKVAESETARELIERIKKVTRRRRLTTPEMVGDPDVAVDPNTVAEYLDNVLVEDQIAELEELCLGSDVNLAEAAACHQILAVLLGEPAQVPPTAFQRMYGLVQGAEAIPYKKARRRQSSQQEVHAEGQDEGDESLLLGMSRPTGARQWLSLGLAALLLLGLGTVLYFALAGREPEARLAGFRPPSDTRPVDRASQHAPPVAGLQEHASKPETTGPMWAGWMSSPGRPVPDQAGSSLASVSLAAGWLAARPGMPGNWLLIFGRTDTPAPEPQVPVDPPNKPTTAAQPAVKPPNTAQMRIATYSSVSTKDSLLFRRADEDWRLVRPGAVLQSNEALLTLPGYRSELALDNLMRLELVGSLPLTLPNYFLETVVTLHPSAEVDLDLTLGRGRVLILNKPGGVALVRLRFLDQAWDLRLLQPTSEVGVELTGRVPPGQGAWTPHFRLDIITRGGEIELRRGPKLERIPAGKRVPWDNSRRAASEVQFPLADAPPWMTKKTPAPEDVRGATTRFASRLIDKLKMGGMDVVWLKVACQESLEENRPWERALGLFCLGAVDQIETVVKELDSNPLSDIRVRALDTLFHWLGRQPDQDARLHQALQNRGFIAAEENMMLRLLHGFDQSNRGVIETLVDNLSSERLAIRELSYFNLHVQLQLQADKLAGFDPAAPADVREAAVRTIRGRLLGKN